MEIRLIECDKIEFLRADPDRRDLDQGVVRGIADSIQAEGMYNPIVVRTNPAKPGSYLGVQGRHRHHAKAVLLGEPLIECQVLAMDDEEAEMAALAENLFRHALSQPEKTRAVKRWHAIFRVKHPELIGKGKAGGAATKRKARARKEAKSNLTFASGANGDSAQGHARDVGAGDESARSFTKTLAAATGVSEATAKREQRLAVHLSDDELQLCEQRQLNKGQMESIANIKDPARRAEVLGRIANGLRFDDAWLQADPGIRKATGKSREREAAEAAAEQEGQPALSDDEWFDMHCGEKAARLANPALFKSDALIFRRITGPRHLFRAGVTGTLEEARTAKVVGPFYHAVNRVIAVSHPKDWSICLGCEGWGVSGGERCPKCHGACYLLNTGMPR
jgi:hypothetical protein